MNLAITIQAGKRELSYQKRETSKLHNNGHFPANRILGIKMAQLRQNSRLGKVLN